MPPRPDVSTERRAQIIQAAIACFLNKGYNNTTMDDIVMESGLSKGSLYWYFNSKDDLLVAASLSFLERLGEDTLVALEGCTTASDKLRSLAQAVVAFAEDVEGLFTLFIEFWASSARREEIGKLWIDLLRQYREIVVALIDEGSRSGEFKAVDSESLAWTIMAAYDGLAAYAVMMPDMDVAQVSQVFVETLLKGLQAGE